jgi:hypothetical protein
MLMGIVALVVRLEGVTYGLLTRDPVSVAELPFYTGFLSNVGVLLWAAAATVCIFSATVSRPLQGAPQMRSFLIASGFVSLWLGLDDVFVFHETAFPIYLGLPESVTLAVYAVVLLAYLLVFFRTLLSTDYVLFVMAGVFFALSVALDMLDPLRALGDYFVEDSAKLTGIVSWFAYFWSTGAAALRGTPGQPREPAGRRG